MVAAAEGHVIPLAESGAARGVNGLKWREGMEGLILGRTRAVPPVLWQRRLWDSTAGQLRPAKSC